jgi:hypothetical protein
MNLVTMIPQLPECFRGELLFASQDGESGSGSSIAKGSANQQRLKPSTWLTIKLRIELSPGSYISFLLLPNSLTIVNCLSCTIYKAWNWIKDC